MKKPIYLYILTTVSSSCVTLPLKRRKYLSVWSVSEKKNYRERETYPTLQFMLIRSGHRRTTFPIAFVIINPLLTISFIRYCRNLTGMLIILKIELQVYFLAMFYITTELSTDWQGKNLWQGGESAVVFSRRRPHSNIESKHRQFIATPPPSQRLPLSSTQFTSKKS